MTDEYLNFDIRLYSCGGDRHIITAELGYRDPENLFPGETNRAVRHDKPIDNLLGGPGVYLRELIGRPEDAKKLGADLWGFLFESPVKELFLNGISVVRATKKKLRIRIRIYDDSGKASSVPWEYCWNNVFNNYIALSRETPVVRYIPTDIPPKALLVPGSVKILAVMASPTDKVSIDLDAEEKWLTEAVKPLEKEGLVQLRIEKGISKEKLYDSFVDFGPHILHYFGHGELQADGRGVLILEKKQVSEPLDAEHLYTMVAATNIKLVVLSACESAAIGEEEKEEEKIGTTEDSKAFMGLAPRLVEAGVPAVIAMQYKVPVELATMFMKILYKQLAARAPLDAAVTEARIGTYFKAEDDVYWAIPVLFMRAPDGIIFQ